MRLVLETHRGSGGSPDPVIAVVRAFDSQNQPLTGLALQLKADGATVGVSEDAGTYTATITPGIISGELTLTATDTASNASVQKTVLVLPQVGAIWDQPEPVGGLVNTPGDEDSTTVSPNGEWLIVATYSPVDLVCCQNGCFGWEPNDGDSPACNTALGPVTGPARPRMPGAYRVISPTVINDAVPQACASMPDGGPILTTRADGGISPIAQPPGASYMFHRQPDGTFAEPTVIDNGSDGFIGLPTTFTWLGNGVAGQPTPFVFGDVVYVYPGGVPPHPFIGQLTPGQDNSLGTYSCPPGTPLGSPLHTAAPGIVPINVGPVGRQAANTSVMVSNGVSYLMSDDESASSPYNEFSQELPDGGFTDWAVMALPGGGDQRQPVWVNGRIAYHRAGDVVSVAYNGGPLDDPASFSDFRVELAHETPVSGRVGEVIATGQPTFAVLPDGGVEMYFDYYVRGTPFLNGQVGVVRMK